jgi:hypothetical protein
MFKDSDSWGPGTNGTTSRNVNIALLDGEPCRRSSHPCNGGLACEFFDADTSFGSKYERNDGEDTSLMVKLAGESMDQFALDTSTVLGKTVSYVSLLRALIIVS